MTLKTRPVTAEALPWKPDDGFSYELVREELRKMALAGDEYGYVAMEIGRLLSNHVKANNLLERVYPGWTVPITGLFYIERGPGRDAPTLLTATACFAVV